MPRRERTGSTPPRFSEITYAMKTTITVTLQPNKGERWRNARFTLPNVELFPAIETVIDGGGTSFRVQRVGWEPSKREVIVECAGKVVSLEDAVLIANGLSRDGWGVDYVGTEP